MKSWPKIIALVVGGIGVSGVFSAWPVTFSAERTWIACDWRVMAVSAVLLIMSYPLATGREWARRILLVAIILIGVSLVLWGGFKVVAGASFTDLSPEQITVVRLSMRIADFSSFFFVFTLLVFGVLFLCHPDVVATFQRRPSVHARV
jgi:hypothetical protein